MPNRIHELFFEKHRLGRGALELLSAEEVADLRLTVLDRPGHPNRARALGFLVQLRDPAALDAIRKILTNSDEDQDLQAAAASHAARIGADAESVLLEAMRYASQPLVRRRIAASLGEVGGGASSDSLRELSQDPDEAVRAQATFSLSLLAAREGIDGFSLPIPSRDALLEPRQDSTHSFTLHQASIGEAARVLVSLADHTYGMTLTRDAVYAIACGPDQFMLVLDDRVTQGGFIDELVARPSLVGLIAAPAPDDTSYSVQWLVLSWPETPNSSHLAVHRPSGQQVLYGRAGVEGRAVAFGLESLRGAGRLAVRLRGSFTTGRFKISEAVAARRREPAALPLPFEFPTPPKA